MKIVSGGQTGVDMAALSFAHENGLPYGGWVPKGRTNEAGRIPDRYSGLIETPTETVSERTKRNVLSADATLILIDGSRSPGTSQTVDFAIDAGRPHLIVDLRGGTELCAEQVRAWLASPPIEVLNIAGPRASEAPGIGVRARAVLEQIAERLGA